MTLLDAICGRFRISGMDEVGWVLKIRCWVDCLEFRVSRLGWVWVVDIRRCGGWVGIGLVRDMLLHKGLNLNLLTFDVMGVWWVFVFVASGTCIPGMQVQSGSR